jgi:hypothetical protein
MARFDRFDWIDLNVNVERLGQAAPVQRFWRNDCESNDLESNELESNELESNDLNEEW